MKFSLAAIAALAGTSAAIPVTVTKSALADIANGILHRRQTPVTANELVDGPCRAVTFIWGRGTNAPGNLGDSGGPQVCDGLKARYGASNVACQGIGGRYKAGLLENLLPEGTSNGAIEEGVKLWELARSKCPQTKIVGGGYSQGAAVIHGLAKRLSRPLQEQTVGLITFGDTRNGEDNGRIPPFPSSKFRIYCLAGDGVCGPLLIVTDAHSEYAPFFGPGADFLIGRIGNI